MNKFFLYKKKKLIEFHAPLLIVRILLFWYQMQQVCIKWGKSLSQYFPICNGVRQGGISSLRLFALYVNQLTNRLIACKAGCYFNDMCINHVLYADDICLLAPSASAMQSLLDVCYEYGTDNDIYLTLLNQYARFLNQKLINDLLQQSFLAMMHLNLLRKLNI